MYVANLNLVSFNKIANNCLVQCQRSLPKIGGKQSLDRDNSRSRLEKFWARRKYPSHCLETTSSQTGTITKDGITKDGIPKDGIPKDSSNSLDLRIS
jgi:hypothetical protein